MREKLVTTCFFVASLLLPGLLLAGSDKELLTPSKTSNGEGPNRMRDPRESIFHTNVPDHPFDVILARPEKNSITVSILAYSDSAVQVVYGLKPGVYRQKTPIIQMTKDEPKQILLTKLAADAHYYYRIMFGRSGEHLEPQPEYEFHTARPRRQPFTFAVQADSHLDGGTDPKLYSQTLHDIAADRPDFLIDLGDTFMNDKYVTYRDSLRQYIAQRYYFGLVCSSAPLFLVLGNHDGETGWRQGRDNEGIAAWSNLVRRHYFANPIPDGFYTGNRGPGASTAPLEDYYSWEWGDALFIVLDPFAYTIEKPRSDADAWNWTLGREQYEWLRATLGHSSARFKFVFLHHLVGGNGKEGRGGVEAARFLEWGGCSLDGKREFASHRAGWAAPIHELLVKAHVSAVFHGHDHLYARQSLDGIEYIETPQPSHPTNGDASNLAAEYGYTSGKILASPGHIRVSVSPTAAKIEYMQAASGGEPAADSIDKAVDSFTVRASP